MNEKLNLKLIIISAVTGILFGVMLMGVLFGSMANKNAENNKVLTTKVDYLKGEVDLYSDLLDVAKDKIDTLEAQNSELKTVLENVTGVHESYIECLKEVLNEYDSQSKLKYCVNQVSIRQQADDIIYQFIIVIYDDNFSFVDTWNCYSVYDDTEFMYTDCDLIKE